MTPPRFRAAVFDLDGTLIDSMQDLADSVNAMLARMDLPVLPDETVRGFVGEGSERLIRRSLGQHESRYAEAAPIWREEYGRGLLRHTRLYPGIGEALRSTRIPLAVLTNKPGAFARRILEGLGVLDRFAAVIGGDEAPRKPDPAGLRRLTATLGPAPLIGDSPIDLATARAAGLPSCAVHWGLGTRAQLAAADYHLDEPQRLAAFLDGLHLLA